MAKGGTQAAGQTCGRAAPVQRTGDVYRGAWAHTLKSKQIQAAMLGLAAGAAGGRRRRRTGSSGSGPRGVLGVPSSSSRDTILLGGAAAEGESGSDESREGRGPCSPGSKAVAGCMVSSNYWAAHEGRRTARPAYRDVGAAQGRRERVRPLLEMEQTMQGELEPHLPAVAFIAKAPMPGPSHAGCSAICPSCRFAGRSANFVEPQVGRWRRLGDRHVMVAALQRLRASPALRPADVLAPVPHA